MDFSSTSSQLTSIPHHPVRGGNSFLPKVLSNVMALKTSERPKKKVREELISLETRRTIKSWDKTFSECLSHWELWGAVVAEMKLEWEEGKNE